MLFTGFCNHVNIFNLVQAVFSFITMQLQFCSVFFTFSLGTRTHYFGRTILHGGAKVQNSHINCYFCYFLNFVDIFLYAVSCYGKRFCCSAHKVC